MAESKERRKVPRKNNSTTPAPDTRAPAPRQTSASAPGEETRQKIAEAAYFRAKQRGFEPGHELEDWIQAESEVMNRTHSPSG